MHCSILDNRFPKLKKNLDGKFSKPSLKNFKIWLSSLKETFLNAQNNNDMHSDNLNFVSSEWGCFFQNGKTDSFPKGKYFPFGSNCRNRSVVWNAVRDFITFLSFVRLCMKFNTFFAFIKLSFLKTILASYNVSVIRLLRTPHNTLSRPSIKIACVLKKVYLD